jgi:succinate dehydrogenase/fumarate reductase flavoprotein subunit
MAGTFGTGPDLIRRLKAAFDKQNIPIFYKHRVNKIIENEKGEVIGVRALNEGKEIFFKARKAVIFGSGGFTHNKEMARNYLKGPIFGGCTVPTSEGDLVTMAIDIGADLGNMSNAWWAPLVLEDIFEGTTATFTSVFREPGDSMIHVNKYGRRCVDEKLPYNERTQSHFVWDPVKIEYPNLLQFMIYDKRCVDTTQPPQSAGSFAAYYAYPVSDKSPWVIKGNTIQELSNEIDRRLRKLESDGKIPPYPLDKSFRSNLEKTLERYNGFASSGVDSDFHRGESSIEPAFNGGLVPPNTKNPTMYPISSRGPYYAVILAPGTLGTKGGPKINTKSQMLGIDGNPIPGLYGAGNCIASPAAAGYWGAGGTIGPAMVFGYIAAENADKEPAKS